LKLLQGEDIRKNIELPTQVVDSDSAETILRDNGLLP